MSRWKSPQAAAQHAERAAKELAQLRKERRNSWLMITGFVLLSLSLVVADYFWLRARARHRREQHERQFHHGQTNAPAQTPTQAR
jgi:heme/copper-type cytochrome/quinol oxidase subunit 2